MPSISFFYGGIACMVAATFTHPIDTIKTRLQLNGELAQVSKSNVVMNMIKEEGVFALWRGLTPSLLREASYSTIRMGLYEPFKKLFSAGEVKEPLYKKIMAGGASGIIGACIANPTDLIKVRFQASSNIKVGVIQTTIDIVKTEGFWGLYRGVGPTSQRAMILTATQLSSYDHTKRYLIDTLNFNEGILTHFVASMVAGFACATTTAPVDLVKSRYMNQKYENGKGLVYSSPADCFVKTFRAEGIPGFFKGWLPSWLRLGPHTIITFIVLEQLRKYSGIKPV
ncbi:hypothetical protein HDV01_006380 [Terramyces sp. JEL0728]|nr:hypothetical protein HDV01_006380 [Terramyces sp. JEL0728]